MDESHYEDMEAGEALDRQIAERVIGDTLPQSWADPSAGASHGDPGGYRVGVRPYSTDIAAAWDVVEALYNRGTVFELCIHREQPGGMYAVSARVTGATGHTYGGRGASAPLAICRAALWAVDTAK